MKAFEQQLDKVLLTSVPVIAYLLLRGAYREFYYAFGVTPEEVGLTYTATLARSAAPMALGIALVLGIVLGLQFLFNLEGISRLLFHGLAFGALVIALYTWIPGWAQDRADHVLMGYALPPPGRFELLDIAAHPVRIGEADGSGPEENVARSELDLRERQTLMYLGRTAETVILYDYGLGETLRVHASEVSLHTQWRQQTWR